MKYITISVLLFLCMSCTTSTTKTDEQRSLPKNEKKLKLESDKKKDNYLSFEKIDNKIEVYFDNSLAFTSEYTKHDKRSDIKVEIPSKTEVLKIILYNGIEPYKTNDDPYWEIMYDLILDGEVVDFVHESKYETKLGKVFEQEYVIDDWRL